MRFFTFNIRKSWPRYLFKNMEIFTLHIWKYEYQYSHMKYGILYISYRKAWMMTFLQEICNFLYFIHENMGTDFSTWSMKSVFYVWKSSCICLECCMFHIWIYVHIFSCMNKEFCIIHIGKFENTFSCRWENEGCADSMQLIIPEQVQESGPFIPRPHCSLCFTTIVSVSVRKYIILKFV